MRKKIGIWITLGLFAASSVLSGCGSKEMKAPELLESVATTDSFRPVEYGDVGDIDTATGTVVPTDYSHFFTDSAKIKEIKVDIGDYVQKGDVLATADVEEIEEQISAIRTERHLLDDTFQKEDELYIINKNRLGFMLQTAYTTQNTESAKEIQKSIDQLEEDNRYERMLHDYKDSSLEKKLNRKQKLLEGTTIVAKASGYVTYIKDISESNEIGKSENVVVISDYENCSIELPSVSFKEEFIHTEKSYRYFFTIIDNKRYDLEKFEYSPEELVVIENKQQYPFMKFKVPEGCQLPEAGSSVPIYRSADMVADVLRVGCDSLNQDEKGTFVYVKKENGGKDDKEVRYISIGKQTSLYAEVVSGLSEGELVYYTSKDLLPSAYTELTLEPADYTITKSANGFSSRKKIKSVYYSEYEGKVISIEHDDNDVVKKGDLICTIQTEQAASSLKKMQNQIKNLQDDYDLYIKQCEKQLKELNEQIADVVTRTNLSTSIVSYNQEGTQEGEQGQGEGPVQGFSQDGNEESQMIFSAADIHTQIQLELEVERIKCEMQKQEIQLNYNISQLKKNYEKANKNNDGSGLMSVYADVDGAIFGMKTEEGKQVSYKERLFQITEEKKDRVIFVTSDMLQIGQKVELTQKRANRTYTGHVSAYAKGGRVYVTSQDNTVYLTTNGMSDGKGNYYYLAVDDPEFYNEQIEFSLSYEESTLYNVFVVPVGTVKTETIATKEYTYVWRVVDGNLVKQYVTKLDRAGSNSTTECIVEGVKAGDVLAIESE